MFTEIKEKEIVGDSDSDKCNFLLKGDNLYSLKLLEKTHKGKIDVIYIDIILQSLIQCRGKIKKCAFAV